MEDVRGDAARAEAELTEAAAAWEREREMLEERVSRGLLTEGELRQEISELRRDCRALELRVAELEGALGAAGAGAPSGGQRTLEQQAVIARLAKTNMSYEARQRTLRTAKRLGVLPPELEGEVDSETLDRRSEPPD